MLGWLDLGTSKFHDWKRRFGKVNEHNAWVPRDHWLTADEKERIATFARQHPLEGYRRLTFMMLDADVVACSPASVYRVLKAQSLLAGQSPVPSKKGTGFVQPLTPHQHWHVDVSYLNIAGTFYFLCSLLDGYSRFIVHWEIREKWRNPTWKPSSNGPAKPTPTPGHESSATTGPSSSPRTSRSSSAKQA